MSNRVQFATRRDFLNGFFSAGALLLGVRFVPAEAAETVPTSGVEKATWNPNVWVGLNGDGSVLIVTHRSEMGTGIRTTLPMVLADEMEADWSRVRLEQAVGSEKYGSQDTDGSCSIRDFYDTMREAGATSRALLVNAAASHWQVPVDEVFAHNHEVIHRKSGRKLGYGELAIHASKQNLPYKSAIQLKKPDEFRYIGKGVPGYDLKDVCTGHATYGFDVQVPGMVYASIERSPVLGGSMKTFDDSQTKAVRGVQQTVVIDQAKPPYGFQALGGVAVIADNTWSASQGRKKLKVEWDLGHNAIVQTQNYKRDLIAAAAKPQKVARKAGHVETGFQGDAKILEATYYTPLLAHAPMEPPAAVALYHDGKVEAWAATQSPQDVQKTVAQALGIKPENVTCHVTLLGGAFGRKSKPDYVAEAAILSKKIGKPVKIAWTREEDMRFDFYHSTSAMYFKAALDTSGKPASWLQRSVFPPIASTFDGKSEYGDDGELGMGWTDVPFDIPNFQAENGPAKPHVRIGWLRSVSNVYHAFGVQSFIDECAHAAGQDPVQYWLTCLGAPRKLEFKGEMEKFSNYGKSTSEYPYDTARLRRVVETVAERSGWSNKKTNKRAVGFAAHRSFLTYVAAVAEVDISSDGKVRIPRVDIAVDCGPIINPDRVKAQFEGASVFGASIALMGEITVADGRVQEGNFDRYPVARMNDAPVETHIHFVKADDAMPTGTGEPGVPPMSPAIYNAVFAATGKRFRELPLKKQKLV